MDEITMKLKTITAHATNPQMPIQTYRFDTPEEAEAPYDVQLNTYYLIRGTWYKEEDITNYDPFGIKEKMDDKEFLATFPAGKACLEMIERISEEDI